jgi:hypothetical protein
MDFNSEGGGNGRIIFFRDKHSDKQLIGDFKKMEEQ